MSSSPENQNESGGYGSEEDNNNGMDTPPYASTPPPELDSPPNSSTPIRDENDEDNDMDSPRSGDDEEEEGKEEKTPVWTAYLDDSQRTYYYNSVTGESVWEAPDEYVPIQTEAEPSTTADAGANDGSEDNDMDANRDTADSEEGGGATPTGTPSGTPTGTPTRSPTYSDGGMTPEHDGQDDDTGSQTNKGSTTPKHEEENKNVWVAYKDDNGAEYYYNAVTQATQWERPEGMTIQTAPPADGEGDAEEDTGRDGDAEKEGDGGTPRQTSPMDTYDDSTYPPNEQDFTEQQPEPEEEEPPEPEEDPTEKAIREANKFVEEPDSIFEPACNKHVGKVIELQGPSGGSDMMKKLISSYRGHTSICGLLALWLTDITAATSDRNLSSQPFQSNSNVSTNSGNHSNQIDLRNKAAESIRQTSEEVINKIAKEKFTKEAGDEILDLVTGSRKIRFLEDMIDSDSWRRLLIDLSATNKDSALLMGCLQRISKRGHNREIAQRINQSDYFGVFNAMLASELSILGKIAVGGVLDTANDDGTGSNSNTTNSTHKGDSEAFNDIDELVSNFKRICCSTAYTYFYAMRFLSDLIKRAKLKKLPEGPKAVAIERAIRKWERLREELEAEMVRPKSTSSESHIAKRRRVDTALTISDLYQRQRCRLEPSLINRNDNGDSNQRDKKELIEQKLDSAVIDLLKKHSMGIQIDDSIADRLLVPHTLLKGQQLSIGELLIAHPSSIKALMVNLFKPSSTRVMTLNLRQKCSKLLAKAIIASKKTFGLESENYGETEDEEEMRLWKMILQGSQLCKEVENMVSFTITDYKELPPDVPENASIGGKLSFVSIKSAPVAQGVILWIMELAGGPEFESSAAYPTLAPSLLSLARIIAKHHPFARPEVLNVAFLFLKHKAPELSYEKVKALKQQILRLLVWLATWSQALGVFGYFAKRLEKGTGTAEIDSSLLRYFIGGSLQIIQPPLSVPLVKVLSKMFGTKACIDAVKSPHFHESKKALLPKLLDYFENTYEEEKTKSRSTCSISSDEMTLVKSLKIIYKE